MTYAFTQYDSERMARAQMRDVSISFKKSQMIAKKLRGMMTDKAVTYLEAVQRLERAVPFSKFQNGAGHKPGIGPGKYPVKASKSFAELIKSAVANAENKGLGTPLKIEHLMCQEGSRPLHAGRQRGHLMKRTHLELVLVETDESKKRPKKEKKAPKGEKREEKTEKPVEKKAEAKEESAKPVEKKAEKATPKSDAPAKPVEKQAEEKKESHSPKSEAKEVTKDGS